MFSYIIVDDEKKAVKNLENKMKKMFPGANYLQGFTSPEKALEFLKTTQPDVVFLDIEMPGMTGFDLLSALENPEFEVIFVTAYDQYAIRAIKHAAIGYVLKPIDNEELEEAVRKAIDNLDKKKALEHNRHLLDLLKDKTEFISIPTTDGYLFIKPESVMRLEGAGGYTKIFCEDGRELLSSYNLGKFREVFGGKHFFQVHRSHIININYVTAYLHEGYIVMKDDTNIPLSKNKKDDFFKHLKGGLKFNK